MDLSHINKQGNSRMVDISHKSDTVRIAKAVSKLKMKETTIERIKKGDIKKGDVLSVAQVAGIMAAKNTSNLIPMCHQLLLSSIDITYEFKKDELHIYSEVKIKASTGVEMEALVATSVAALTIYDMCKAIDKEIVISETMLLEKIGGKSGQFKRL